MTIKALGLLSLVTASTAMAQSPESTPVDGNIDWVFSLDEGQILSRTENKPMFVVFRCER